MHNKEIKGQLKCVKEPACTIAIIALGPLLWNSRSFKAVLHIGIGMLWNRVKRSSMRLGFFGPMMLQSYQTRLLAFGVSDCQESPVNSSYFIQNYIFMHSFQNSQSCMYQSPGKLSFWKTVLFTPSSNCP